MDNEKKEKIKMTSKIIGEWCMQFTDAGRLPIDSEQLWTNNNYTERINRAIEATYSGKQTVLTFELVRENVIKEHSGN